MREDPRQLRRLEDGVEKEDVKKQEGERLSEIRVDQGGRWRNRVLHRGRVLG